MTALVFAMFICAQGQPCAPVGRLLYDDKRTCEAAIQRMPTENRELLRCLGRPMSVWK